MIDEIEIRRKRIFNMLLNPTAPVDWSEEDTAYQRAIYLIEGISPKQPVYTRELRITKKDNISVQHEFVRGTILAAYPLSIPVFPFFYACEKTGVIGIYNCVAFTDPDDKKLFFLGNLIFKDGEEERKSISLEQLLENLRNERENITVIKISKEIIEHLRGYQQRYLFSFLLFPQEYQKILLEKILEVK